MKIPDAIGELIDRYHESLPREKRDYIGVSQIGGVCPRKIWYNFNHSTEEKLSGRILRLFRRGTMEEETVIADLNAIGKTVTGRQLEVVFSDKIKGHIDGLLKNGTRLLEIKTHNDKSFKDLEKNGVRISKPEHYAQMVVYMYGLGLKDGEYFAVNKNDDTIYTERVKADTEHAEFLLSRADDIVNSDEPPPPNESFECRWCPHLGICNVART